MSRLSDSQRRALHDDGFVKLPGAVPADKVMAARRAINAALGDDGIPPERLQEFRARTYTPDVTTSDAILDLLFQTPLWAMAESVIGPGTIGRPRSGQIALRFPSMAEPHAPRPHIDGMYSPHNGVPKGTIANFTALIGVYLSDAPEPDSGNFTVWPGSHRLYADYFAEKGPQALLEGMPQVDLPEPSQLLVQAGDAVLSHYQIGHGNAGNASANIRYAIYFRLTKHGHDDVRWDCMTDLWREWDGMRDLDRSAAGVR